MRARTLASVSVVMAIIGIVAVVVAQIRLAANASISTLHSGEEIITQVAHPLAPWPAVSDFGAVLAIAGTLGLVAVVGIRVRASRRSAG